MGVVGQCSGASNPGRVFSSPVEAAVVEVALIAQASLVRLFPLWRTLYRHIYMLPNVQGNHQSFPFAKLNEATEYVTENKDAVESEDEDSDANLGDSDNFSDGSDSEMSEGENDSDDEESSEGYSDEESSEGYSDEESDDNEDDDDDDTNEDEDSDDEDADDDEEEDGEEEKRQLPIKKKK